jgi:hypothetical protein
MRLAFLVSACLCGAAAAGSNGWAQTQDSRELRPPSAFASVHDDQARSRALFTEAGKVITHPRCMNCHPATDRPLQGNDRHPHVPPTWRGAAGAGVPGTPCASCHTEHNFTLVGTGATYRSVPGHPRWQLAPIEMAWEGKSLHDICEQIKDPARNGGRDLALLYEHMAHDDLVAWGWNPGEGREPAPGTQERLGELIKAWVDTGAHCP